MLAAFVISSFMQLVGAPPDDPGYADFKNPSAPLVASFNLYLEDFRAAYFLPEFERQRVLEKIYEELPRLFFSDPAKQSLKHFSKRPFVFEMANMFERHIDDFFSDDPDDELKQEMLADLWTSFEAYVDEPGDKVLVDAKKTLWDLRKGSYVVGIGSSVVLYGGWTVLSTVFLYFKRKLDGINVSRNAARMFNQKKKMDGKLRDEPGATDKLKEIRQKTKEACSVRLRELAQERRKLRGLEEKRRANKKSKDSSKNDPKKRSFIRKSARLIGLHLLSGGVLGGLIYYGLDQPERRDWDAQIDSIQQIIKPTVYRYLKD